MSLRGARAAAALAAAVLAAAASATPSGRKWFLGSNPSPRFAVYDHGAGNRPVNGVSWSTALQAVRSSYTRWVTPNVSCTSWSTTYNGTFLTPAGQAAINGNDSQNLVVFLGGTQVGWTWPHDAATLALTTTTYFTGTGEIFDGDMEINNNFSWKAGGEGNQATAFDLESVVTHEAGHYLGLAHTPASTAVMYASFAAGEVRSNLSAADIDDVCGVYPGTAPVGEIGTFCADNQNCSGAYPICRAPASTTSSAKICTRQCFADPDCPTGYTCQPASPGTGNACLVRPGSSDLCRFCASDEECSTGLCAYDDQGHRWCTISCQQAADCGPGYQCTPTGQPNLSICQPQNANGDTCNNADIPGFNGQCTNNAQCAPGYECVTGGYCQAPGTLGSRCELSDYCAACSVCIGTLEEAYCRACCGGTGGGGRCTACANPACATGFTCYTVVGSNDNVCAATAAAGSCQACDGSTPCQDGMQCIAGRCHAFCNPEHPGRCEACFPTATPGVGVCACSDQVVGTGSPCGTQPNGDFRACASGNWCAGSPPTCLALCTPGDNSTCPAGQTCAVLDGKSVCTGGSTPAGSRCGSAVGGSSCTGISCAAGLTCYQGRCYEPCNPAAPACNPSYGCVPVSGSNGVCACSDQRSAAHGPCGAVLGSVYACRDDLTCVRNMCRIPCGAAAPCSSGTCETVDGVSVCSLPAGVDAGMYGPVGGCGCAAGGWAGVFPVMLVLMLLVRATERRASGRRDAR